MGHHVFLWRMDSATDGGYVEIKNNDFGSAPVGAAIYSIISPEAERQFAIENNKFQKNDGLLIRFCGEDFTNIKDYIAKTSKDIGGVDIL